MVYPWWKNLVKETTVHVFLRREVRIGSAEVLPEEDGDVRCGQGSSERVNPSFSSYKHIGNQCESLRVGCRCDFNPKNWPLLPRVGAADGNFQFTALHFEGGYP